ncbi:MAG TPA: HAMP domain-containing sensor histidine kinase [Longimicrobiales bacterium]|nr:HAMP domain-containing sensor histidine kinase [Longimicrobiales bacterium]
MPDRAYLPSEARFLLDASSALASSLDWSESVRHLAEILAPALCDWCCLDVLTGPGTVRRVCGGGANPERTPLLRELEATFALDLDSEHPAARAIRSGEPVHLQDLGIEDLRRYARQPRRLELARRLGVRSTLSVPITARGRVLGSMTLVQTREPRFRDGKVALALELGQRAGLSIDNALLYMDAQKASRAKSDFLAVMSHELRTPLNSILGYVDLIHAGIGGPVSDQQRSHLDRIRISSRHLLQIIDEILTYSRMDAGRERPRVEKTTLPAIFADVAAVAEPLARERGLRFVVDEVPDVELMTDPQKVRQVLLNLLTNAVKFTESGWVRLSAEVAPEACTFVVSDSGPGIGSRDLERIFEPFWQVENPHTRRRGGTGLGLAVSRRLCELLGGALTVESVPGEGATFRATVRSRLREADIEAGVDEARPTGSQWPVPTPAPVPPPD